MQASELQKILEDAMTDCQVIVQGDDGRHFEVIAIGEVFASLKPVQKQQYVYAGINDLISSGVVHAVQIRTYTPEQWKDAEQLRVG
ncbi:BolA family protein [Oceanospirillum beijerinckii]|uniref:BolA family protein n=1 Tax=Oceanospirillum beijerinckii TaxID=64976 RepID=UPI00041456B4|nr:BolA/IbaG family iron-sulfur metabolism protein [Oceanospirillum beijerinckii]MAC45627.1 cell division protein BolA [Oceanospirillum sp.]